MTAEFTDEAVEVAAQAYNDAVKTDAFGDVGDDEHCDAMQAALAAARPFMTSRPALDREAVEAHYQVGRKVYVTDACACGWFGESFRTHQTDAVMALAVPVPTREEMARAVDPDAFDDTKKRSGHPAAVIQWAARKHMAYQATDAVLALLNGSAK